MYIYLERERLAAPHWAPRHLSLGLAAQREDLRCFSTMNNKDRRARLFLQHHME